ncbi:MAG: branched-chain amino acid ABC transporter permease [Deltaproteobacteria bacterium]|nr:branched-chain amino acid ABC transporter permease [Deltaproteobacteria bacterium]MBW2019400.1 branched-chain amino acid ABC transporter permease [Deltaproteobacteria bacterium]MBW2074237.1 branched-chain amino acid ABC transporter permease [Deltaproteobacteria bacterium]RLB83916.1 MAG: branched-chain amino acid ABC transporter permease [Deltaproteobacteria bacterium]
MVETFPVTKHKNTVQLAGFGLGLFLFPWVAQRIPYLDHYMDVMVFVGIYSIMTIALCLLMGYAGQISLGHASFFGLGAYISGVITTKYGLNPWFCLVVGMVVSAAVALAIGAPSLKLRGHYLAMATLAFCIIITIIFNETMAVTGGPDGLAFIPGIGIMGYALDSVVKYYYLVWGVVFVVLLVCLNIIRSRVGRALRSIHGSELAASAMGVNVAKYKIWVFVLSAVLASVAGSLYAHYLNFINPASFDLFVSIKLLIMIILGGMHSLWGAIVGAALVTFLSYEWLQYFEEAEVMIYGAIVLLIVIFLPGGVVSIPEKVGSLWRR